MDPTNPDRRRIIKIGLSGSAAMATAGCIGNSTNTGSNGAGEALSTASTSMSTRATEFKTPPQIAPLFLTDAEFKTLEAVVDNIVPADASPGALQAQCARGVQLLLSAFSFNPPMIFAGGPFSDRGGNPVNQFQNFIAIDSYEELAWRIKIEGSNNQPERSFNGNVIGWQTIYRKGLAALNAAATQAPGGSTFEALPSPAQQLILNDTRNEDVNALMNIATPHVIELMYGAPEYGGNADLSGWGFTEYDGDVQPRGYTRQQVVEPDNPSALDMLGLSRRFSADDPQAQSIKQAALLPVPSLDQTLRMREVFTTLIGMTSDEFGLAMMIDGQSNQQRIRRFVQSKMPRKAITKAGGR